MYSNDFALLIKRSAEDKLLGLQGIVFALGTIVSLFIAAMNSSFKQSITYLPISIGILTQGLLAIYGKRMVTGSGDGWIELAGRKALAYGMCFTCIGLLGVTLSLYFLK